MKSLLKIVGIKAIVVGLVRYGWYRATLGRQLIARPTNSVPAARVHRERADRFEAACRAPLLLFVSTHLVAGTLLEFPSRLLRVYSDRSVDGQREDEKKNLNGYRTATSASPVTFIASDESTFAKDVPGISTAALPQGRIKDSTMLDNSGARGCEVSYRVTGRMTYGRGGMGTAKLR